MPRVVIDGRPAEVPPGGTILDAARKLGLDIPTLCHLDGHPPRTSCMICQVRVKGRDRLVPSCATPAEDGMEVESETEELHEIRKTGLELLLADHLGDCVAPCQNTCPADMDIPLMLRQVSAGNQHQAIATIKRDIALPAVLGRVCPELCEKGCRLSEIGPAVSICQVKRQVADADLASDTPYLPPCKRASGKTVAVVGAGPTGLAAAYHLLLAGHSCTVFDERAHPGGTLRSDFDQDKLPPRILDGEIAVIGRLGADFRMSTKVGPDVRLEYLRRDFDAVLLAVGAPAEGETDRLGLPEAGGRLAVDRKTHQTAEEGVFAAGEATRPGRLVVRNVADGKSAAYCIDQFLSGRSVTGPPQPFACRAGRVGCEELKKLAKAFGGADRVEAPAGPAAGLTPEQAEAEALRCLHCDCGQKVGCKLSHYAGLYAADPKRFRGERRPFERHLQHADIVYEPGKCILCGLCVQLAEEAGEPLGLAFIGRGFDVRVGVPFDRSIAEGLERAARSCAEACPTGALSLKSELHGCEVAGPGTEAPAKPPAPLS